ncbi:MAG: EAL domain-containing protein [Chromatiaceae bacterium]|nr:EAL domain-containing protein [Chromatiaceae bacterium]MCP5409060.1 EAL domain-containing protein [Chromatiaceae bacterium]MCP5441952.1 EAL domain-containing protein [Chromatiaceae bacterium]
MRSLKIKPKPAGEPNRISDWFFGKGLYIQRLFRATTTLLLIGYAAYAANDWLEVRSQVESDLNHINRLIGQTIESTIQHHETVLKILGQRFLDIDAASYPERGRSLIEELIRVNPAMAGFGLAQPDGQLLIVSGVPEGKPLPNLLFQHESASTFLKAFDTDRLVVGRTYFMQLLKKWLIPIRIGVRDERGKVKLVMAAGLSINASDALWNAIKLPEGMRVTVLRHDGFVQLSLPILEEENSFNYNDPVPDHWVSALHKPLQRDPFYPESLAVSGYLREGSMRTFVSFPIRSLWELFSGQMIMPTLLFSAAFLLTWILFHNVSRNQRRHEKRLYNQAHFDTLTGLPNRFLALNHLEQLLKEAWQQDSKVAVLFLDLDDFKKINDSLGHEVGDQLLIEAAQRLRDSVRSDDTVARLGGDEFVVMLSGIKSAADAQSVAEKLIDQFQNPYQWGHRELVLTLSIGIAIYPDDGDCQAELMRNADSAMYYSKRQGRNVFHFFTNAMNENATRRLLLEEQLRSALERDELSLYYQPLIDVSSGCMAGVEALLRWNNPVLGAVSPNEFIPIAEQSGLIVPIGRHVIMQALKSIARWRNSYGWSLKISVNLSPRQFRDPTLLPYIQQTLVQTGVDSDCLELEITEGVLISSHANIDQMLNALNEMGVSIAMDDFGTGYSSLSYLRRYPFDTLKIDRSFVSDITTDPQDRELVNAVIAMAHSLGLTVVAEGVESEAELNYLNSRGCDLAQGYLFSRPLSASELIEWAKKNIYSGHQRKTTQSIK